MKNILFFGDSLSAGYGLVNPSLESFPALIERKLRDDFYGYKVINAGVSGDTTRGALTRLDLLLNYTIDVFVLELGANDFLRGINTKETAQNLQLIVNKVISKYPLAKLMLLGMEIPDFLAGGYAREFRAIFKDLAKANKMLLLPFLLDGVAGKLKYNMPDRLHPTAEGYKIIAENVWQLLKNIL